MVARRLVAVAEDPDDIALGTDHPTLDGMPRIALATRDGVVLAAQWLPGGVHRGAEKLMESRDYRQALMLTDRHDWLGAFGSELGLAIAAERAMGIVPPARAQVLRIALAELTRMAHHLCLLAALPGDVAAEWRDAAWGWRESVLDLIEDATGQRIHPMISQIGGLREAPPQGWVDRIADAAGGHWPALLGELDTPALAGLLARRYTGVAVLSAEVALGCGASGPVARASGIDLDLRRDDPYLPYPAFAVPVRHAGDAAARVRLLLDELAPSIGLLGWAATRHADLAGGSVNVRLPKVVRVPESTTYTWTENPGGINGYLMACDNSPTPLRLKIRSSGFGNACALGHALAGTRVADLPAAIASFGIVSGDVDR